MITRPLELASKLRPAPRNFDGLFYVNAGLLVLFFSLFGSRFVLAPGLGVDLRLPVVPGANANAKPVTHVIDVDASGQILTNDGIRTLPELEDWLNSAARTVKEPMLLVRGDFEVPVGVLAQITSAARRAGFAEAVAAIDPADLERQKGR